MRKILGLLAIAALVNSGALFANQISFGPKAAIGLGSNIGDLGVQESRLLSGFNYGFGVEGLIEMPASTFLATVGLEYSRRTVNFKAPSVKFKIITPQIELPIYLGGLFADQFVMMGGLIPRFGIGDVKAELKVENFPTQKSEGDYDESGLKQFGLGGGFRFGAIVPMAAGKLMPTVNFVFDILDRNDAEFNEDDIRNFSIDASVTYLF